MKFIKDEKIFQDYYMLETHTKRERENILITTNFMRRLGNSFE